VWHTIPGPQFASAVHDLAWQYLMTVGGVVDGGGVGQSVPGGHVRAGPGSVVTPESTQVKLCGQSLSVVQVCAAARPPRPIKAARVVTPRRNFVDDIVLGLSWAVRRKLAETVSKAGPVPARWRTFLPPVDRKIAVPRGDHRQSQSVF
jgi:hypothetical protein